MNPLRFGVIGLGKRMGHVLRAIKRAGGNFDIVCRYDPEDHGLDILGEEGIAPGEQADSAAAVAATPGLDLILIGSPNHLHLEHLDAALAGGAPVFCEKPIVRTLDESVQITQRLTKPGTPLVFVGLVLRSAPIVKKALEIAASGAIGRIVSIDATEHLPPEHGAYLARNWRRKNAWGGSFLLDKICHDFDIFNALIGARASRVASFGGRSIFDDPAQRPQETHYPDGHAVYGAWPGGWGAEADAIAADGDANDHQVAIVEYANGVRLSFHANSHNSLRERRWMIVGTKGTIIAELYRNKLMWRTAPMPAPVRRVDFETITADGHNGADEAMAEDLLAALSCQRPFPVAPSAAIEAGVTVMAIDEAAETGRTIDLAPTWSELDAAAR
jgi:predicted dehydrogenase